MSAPRFSPSYRSNSSTSVMYCLSASRIAFSAAAISVVLSRVTDTSIVIGGNFGSSLNLIVFLSSAISSVRLSSKNPTCRFSSPKFFAICGWSMKYDPSVSPFALKIVAEAVGCAYGKSEPFVVLKNGTFRWARTFSAACFA